MVTVPASPVVLDEGFDVGRRASSTVDGRRMWLEWQVLLECRKGRDA
ncbi:hypothetical protein OG742_45560 [Streptomyces sp. NBC_00828]